MASSGIATGYGPQASIKSFDGTGDFQRLQQDLQHASVFSNDVSSMDPKCQAILEEIEHEITRLRLKDKDTAKHTAEIAYMENKRKEILKEDQAFYRMLTSSIKGRAKDIACPHATAFVLNEKANLPGAQAYQNLFNEYAEKPQNMVDKYAEKQAVLSHFITPNLSSPQIHVHLITIESQITVKTWSKPGSPALRSSLALEFSIWTILCVMLVVDSYSINGVYSLLF